MLVELGLVEQSYQAVLEVLNDGATVTDVARRFGVARQRVHGWLPTDELHQLYALEGFLDRLTRSAHVDQFVLKGGVLLAAYNTRRPTRDVDLSASAISNEVEAIRQLIADVLAVVAAVISFSELPIGGTAGGYTWQPVTRSWT